MTESIAQSAPLYLLCIFMLAATAFSDDSYAVHSNSVTKPKIMVHYMTWYEAKSVSGNWGWHWTMNHFDPEQIDETGKREIASHYYPLIGPYDSYDPDVSEYHVLLMKLAGIDGVIIDWYGFEDFYDYATLNRNTSRIIEFAEKAALEFAICYEDQTVKHMVNNHHISEDDSIQHGQQVMLYLQEEWFDNSLYLKLNGRPVLLNFGPQYFTQSSQWDSLFSVLEVRPQFFTLNRRLMPSATGAFPWPPMWKSQNGVLSQADLGNYLSQFYQDSSSWDFVIGGAFAGFRDVYEEVGVRNSFGYLDARRGKTLIHTFEKALTHNADVIQIVTWNDFGEGTNIEPTEDYGYRYLESIQNLRRRYVDSSFSYSSEDLALPRQLYDLRKKYKDDKEIMSELDGVFILLSSGNLEGAKEIVSSILVAESVR